MKLHNQRTRSEAGISLIDGLVYIGLFAVLLTCATRFFSVVYHHNKAAASAASYTISALDAAKQWRRDIANAKDEPELIRDDYFDVIRINQANGEQVRYRINGTQLERHNGEDWVSIIRRVTSSIMLPDQREHVRAWRWELSMETKSRFLGNPVRFSFTAVPGHPLAPRPTKAQPISPTPEPSP